MHEEHEEENSERWLLTYSDLITLLLALFIILYSIAQVDAKKFNAIASQFREQMGQAHDAGNAPYMDPPTASAGSNEGVGENALDQVYEEIKDFIEQNGLQDQISLVTTDNFVRIHIKDTMMFMPDSAQLLDQSRPVLENIESAINQVYQEVDSITFSGHTADAGDHSLLSDQTSWRLSTERAIEVLNSFIAYGLPQNKLSIQGLAYFEPIAANDTEEGRAQNRRVEITIYKNPS